jgi:hypothetical protein
MGGWWSTAYAINAYGDVTGAGGTCLGWDCYNFDFHAFIDRRSQAVEATQGAQIRHSAGWAVYAKNTCPFVVQPVTSPESLIAKACPSPKSFIVPPLYRNACQGPYPATSEYPTTSPEALMPVPTLESPPRVPKSVMLPPRYKKACWRGVPRDAFQ